jgi:Ser/Thr protein kinase RdoA (MazF antagonist)
MLQTILDSYGIEKTEKTFGTGLINHTWIIEDEKQSFILQKINDNVFKKPADIAHNIRLIGAYLSTHSPGYLFVTPAQNKLHEDIIYLEGEGYFRLFPFVPHSHTIDVVSTPAQAYEAARQFGRFTHLLADFPTETLKITLPDFHNLPLRYRQFEESCINGNTVRITKAKTLIAFLQHHRGIVTTSEKISTNPAFKKRVTHHDTKISNVLFDEQDRGLCVIDLDTVMPGYFISDVGDMLRTYLSPVSEEEADLEKISIREDFFKAVAAGYLEEMKNELTPEERTHFIYAGKFMIYMQALRFLTDYLNNDLYYGSTYEGQNFIRANNQVQLLKLLLEKEDVLQQILLKL